MFLPDSFRGFIFCRVPENSTSSWKKRKLAKHEFYLAHYLKNEYSFENDDKLIKFIGILHICPKVVYTFGDFGKSPFFSYRKFPFRTDGW
jgi:hypothetical protein